MGAEQPQLEQAFQTALVDFRNLRREQTRTSVSGQKFLLVSNVKAKLRQRSPSCPTNYENDLDRLGHTAYHRENPSPPPLRAEEFKKYFPIFCNLLDIDAPSLVHQFRDNNLDTLPIELDALRKHIKAPYGYTDFHERFYENQFAWCPMQFEKDMGTSHRHSIHKIISPFSRKEEIKPYRDGKGPRVNTATLYAIEVPEELVEPELRKQMASAKIERQEDGTDSSGNGEMRYRFALKQFKSSKHDQFIIEKQMFSNLKNKEGMIQYIGWFRSSEPNGRGTLEECWNIVLELADFDFYTAIRKESPPISAKEILGFWQTMAEISGALASIHTVVVDGQHYSTLHGDIKPENILRVDDRFKLADPGEASMMLKTAGSSGDQKTRATGGTRTYAAPEKSAYLDGLSSKKPEVLQTSDVWSLGCVLSIAATYVVLGTQGVLIYSQLRRVAIFKNKGNSSDAFHDGTTVLPEVRHWHRYLREAARRNDAYTPAVLDMVDDYMLVEKDRWSARKICQQFDKLFASTKPEESQVPKYLHTLLQRIDLQSEQMYDQHSGIRRVDSDEVAQQMIPQVPNLPAAEVEFESRQILLEQAIQPVAQRSQERMSYPSHSRSALERSASTTVASSGHGPSQDVVSSYVGSVRRPSRTTPLSNELELSRTSTLKRSHDSSVQPRNPITVWQVKTELEKRGKESRRFRKNFSSLFKPQHLPVKGKNMSDNLENLDRRLEDEFKNRDIVYLVDNGTTMSTHWGKATHTLEVLVWRSLGYDDNGMELYFTNPDTNPKATVAESRSQQVKHFLRAMKYAQPEEPKSPAQAVNTTIVPELARIINRYTRAKASKSPPRKKTVIILTDGIWGGMNMERTIDIYLRSVMHELKDLHGDLPIRQPGQSQEQVDISTIRPVTIQFVQFGGDAHAVERLRRLDDDMKLYGCPDLIDTEHADGDVYKMFLGSLCQDIDKQAAYLVGPAISTTPSIERDSFRRQDTLYLQSQREYSSAAVSQTLTRASDQHDRISGDQDQASSPFAIQHHELPASPDRRGQDLLTPLHRSSTIGSADPVSPSTVASPDGMGFMRASPSHDDTQRSPPTSPASSAPPTTPSRSSRRP
ncbi:Dual specificity protein kinase TTK [Colletotrichum shisoi]|uniref:Dual specificity protein kinase TTK n=1 Tax=Colletotrichum shisoi TaxID=2078593 RepID=A0A5Q4BNP8_9PEZI|nr:Dual specificity protein kinase TTK [Colletotrichum shisoi]